MAQRARPPVYTVSAVNHHISSLFTEDPVLGHIYVRGELSNVKYASSGHLYFSLKDEKSQIRCAMWASYRKNLKTELKDGDSIIAFGQIAVYERDGSYQFYVTAVRSEQTTGQLYERYEQLKKKLLEMGMFDASYKKPIPKYINTLGVVTAGTGAAIRDIINVSRRRNPGIRILLYPARVQGDGAAGSVAEGIETLDGLGICDVILVGRGGGSIEDLWAFNEEKVAYAIWNCKTPVISAVGHETDTTIADFVADLRAPTPSAGAELAVADMRDTAERLDEAKLNLLKLMNRQTDMKESMLREYAMRLRINSPEGKLTNGMHFIAHAQEAMDRRMDALLMAYRNRADKTSLMLDTALDRRADSCRHRLDVISGRLRALSPGAKLRAGYAYVEDESGRGLSSVKGLERGTGLVIHFYDGRARADVTEVKTDDQQAVMCDRQS